MPRATRNRACTGKMRHATQQEAEDHLRRLQRDGAFAPMMETYRCAYCGGWHVGHKRGRRKR